MFFKILVGINNKIQKQWAFFGPKWFCWLLVFFGFEFWFIEATFKALGFASYGPGYLLLNYIHEVFLDKNYLYFFILITLISVPVICPLIYFPSFLFLLCRVVNEEFKFGEGNIITYIIILTSPIWFQKLIFFIGDFIN